MKKMSAFRLSAEAVKALEEASARTGMDKTAILEFCLAKYSGTVPNLVTVAKAAADRAMADALKADPIATGFGYPTVSAAEEPSKRQGKPGFRSPAQRTTCPSWSRASRHP